MTRNKRQIKFKNKTKQKFNNYLLKNIYNTTENYSKFGARSNKKVFPLHGAIAKSLSSIFKEKDGYKIESFGYTNKEGKCPTLYGDEKDIDIKISKNDIPIACIMVKYICSSYTKNAKNYLETMQGETASLRTIKNENGNNIIVWQILVLPEYIPNYNSKNICTGIEKIDEKKINKYVKVCNADKKQYSTPNLTSVYLINTNNLEYLEDHKSSKKKVDIKDCDYIRNIHISYSNIDDKDYSEETKEFLKKDFGSDLEQFSNLILAQERSLNLEKIKKNVLNFIEPIKQLKDAK